MTETAEGRKSLMDEFRALTPKQIIIIAIALIAAVLLQTFGFAAQCLGFLIIAAILYMLPHMMGVSSVKIKAVLGVVFVVITLMTATFYSGPSVVNGMIGAADNDYDEIGDITLDEETGLLTADFYIDDVTKVDVEYGVVDGFNYSSYWSNEESKRAQMVLTESTKEGVKFEGSCTISLEDGKINYVRMTVERAELNDKGEPMTGVVGFFKDTGAPESDVWYMSFTGMGMYVAFTAAMFFLILIFSALMRRSMEKTRTKMEADGRLYPQGYGRCKECGGMVLPGEITCRKCGAYIDVPEELRAKKKDFFTCSECGAEVPNDADVCPKCGAAFDEVENEVVHADGTVEVTTEVEKCPECGEEIPANVTFCPKCGRKI